MFAAVLFEIAMLPSVFCVTPGVPAGTLIPEARLLGIKQGAAVVQICPGFKGPPGPSSATPRVPTYPSSNTQFRMTFCCSVRFHCWAYGERKSRLGKKKNPDNGAPPSNIGVPDAPSKPSSLGT